MKALAQREARLVERGDVVVELLSLAANSLSVSLRHARFGPHTSQQRLAQFFGHLLPGGFVAVQLKHEFGQPRGLQSSVDDVKRRSLVADKQDGLSSRQ